eukprot:CAMPEP_0184311676 /NCGR_PEP_ID=MMETSP1049-20130417/43858_1 /TAXON_ID=77928 /ORGANISM="Proteomonas sulcata, Strain CCMP704" /LENGTH=40 /DNA_ID= /DNA_START= /DNA_END= /DNA_ORIENTATION=
MSKTLNPKAALLNIVVQTLCPKLIAQQESTWISIATWPGA